jgi:hypothetical protein
LIDTGADFFVSQEFPPSYSSASLLFPAAARSTFACSSGERCTSITSSTRFGERHCQGTALHPAPKLSSGRQRLAVFLATRHFLITGCATQFKKERQPKDPGSNYEPEAATASNSKPTARAALRNLQPPQFHSDRFRIGAAAAPFPTLASSSGGDGKA